jgi:hypothetical protein
VVLKEKRCTDDDDDNDNDDDGGNKGLWDRGWSFTGADVSRIDGEDGSVSFDELSNLCSSSSSVRLRRFGIIKVSSISVMTMGS